MLPDFQMNDYGRNERNKPNFEISPLRIICYTNVDNDCIV